MNTTTSKILPYSALEVFGEQQRTAGQKIVWTNGCFDILHVGHVRYLEAARALGDILVVGVNSDDSVRRLKGPDRPLNPVDARMEVLAGLEAVSHVIPFEQDTPLEAILGLRPDVIAKGGDYGIAEIVGATEVTGWGGKVAVLPFVAGYSTTKLIEKSKEQLS